MIDVKNLYSSSEKIAKEIRMISRAFKNMSNAGLKRETIVLLLHNMSGVGKTDIRNILFSIERLEKEYTNPETP